MPFEDVHYATTAGPAPSAASRWESARRCVPVAASRRRAILRRPSQSRPTFEQRLYRTPFADPLVRQ